MQSMKTNQNPNLGCWCSWLAAWLSRYGIGLWLVEFPWSMPDLWLKSDHFVGKVSAMGQPTKPSQPSISLRWW